MVHPVLERNLILKFMAHKFVHRLLGPWSFKRVFISLLEIYLLLLIFAWFFADLLVHHPPHHSFSRLPGEITLKTSDGVKISAIWMPNPKATHTLLFSHGNGEDMDYDSDYLQELSAAGFNVFAYDYRGYGHSEGKPNEEGLYRDIDAAYDYLTKNLNVSPAQIIVLGRSLGSGPSTYLASSKPVGGLVLESAFTSAFRVAIPFPLFPFNQFPNLERIHRVKCPILIMHGTLDTLIPIVQGQTLFAAASAPKTSVWIQGAGHNNLFPHDPDRYLEAIRTFSNSLSK